MIYHDSSKLLSKVSDLLKKILKEYMNTDFESHKTSFSFLNTDKGIGDRGLLTILFISKFIDSKDLEYEKILVKIKFMENELENVTDIF